MKSNTRIKITILMTLGIALALSPMFVNTLYFNAGYGDKSSEQGDTINFYDDNLKISKISGKIHIIGNSGWVNFRSDGNCTGSGTYSDPYVIEDLVIDGGGSGDCIWIENSDVYFRIENCTAYNSGYPLDTGIKLSHVNNSQLIDNNCSSNSDGIRLEDSNNNTISGNTASNNSIYGISLSHCDDNAISGNTANDNIHGIRLELYSENNTISGNTANNNNQNGIDLRGNSDDTTISGNTANNNDKDGILLSYGSNNNMVSGNTANNNNQSGIRLYSSDDNTVSGNTVNNNEAGIYLYYSDTNTVSGNTASNNSIYGGYLEKSNYNTVSGNILIGNDECIVEEDCEGNIFKDNEYCDYGEGDGDGDEKIPGYDPFFLLGVLSAVAILMRKKLKKTLK